MNSTFYQRSASPFYLKQNPYNDLQPFRNLQTQQLKSHTLSMVAPLVQYGLWEAQFTSYHHAMTEIAAISYLIGRGYDPHTAHRIVESWEVNEVF